MPASKNSAKQPLFFSELDAFIGSLPSQHSHSLDNHQNSCLNSYLDHYNLQLFDQHIASNYCILATNFSPSYSIPNAPTRYTIVQQYWQTNHTAKNNIKESVSAKAKGTVVIVHGYLDHTGLYGRAIRWALTQGYDVLSFDLPGHGLSSGDPASIAHFDVYSDALNHVLSHMPNYVNTQNQQGLAQPLIALGQSTGCAVICNTLLKNEQAVNPSSLQEKKLQKHTTHPQKFSQVVLLAPLVRSHHWRWLRYVYFLLRPHISSIQRKFVHSSHNKEFNTFIKNLDPLQSSRIPLLWLGAMEQWYQTIKNTSQTCSTPLTILQGTSDTTVDWHYNIPAITRIFPYTQTHYINNAQHHLVNESHEYWQIIEANLTEQLHKITSTQPHQ
jgi:alpha-beta hydrolase superfamily lysophospholipase